MGGEPVVRATTPDHRRDIGQGVIGVADLMEEIARVYGYERIPATCLADELPPQHSTWPWNTRKNCEICWQTWGYRRSPLTA